MSEMDFYQLGVSASTIEIPLTRGKVALIDIEDYERVSQYRWYANLFSENWYAATKGLDHKTTIMLHRFILNPKPEEEIDHINHNGLDDRRCNMRIATHQQNMMNIEKIYGSSKYKGVCWDKRINSWRCEIGSRINRVWIGRFFNEEDAARAYDKKAKELYGDFAVLNLPKEIQN